MTLTSRFITPAQKREQHYTVVGLKASSMQDRIPKGSNILIDTANVLAVTYHELPELAAVDVLRSIERELARVGLTALFVMEHRAVTWHLHHTPANKVAPLRQFCREKVVTVPGEADEALLQMASHSINTFILSNDRFKNYAEVYPQVVGTSRVCSFVLIPDFAQALSISGMGSLIFLSAYEDEPVAVSAPMELAPELDCIEPREVVAVTERATETVEGLFILRKKAAEHDPHAFEVLATYYAEGRGVDRDFKKSVCLDRAAQVAQKRAWQSSRRRLRQRANSRFLGYCA